MKKVPVVTIDFKEESRCNIFFRGNYVVNARYLVLVNDTSHTMFTGVIIDSFEEDAPSRGSYLNLNKDTFKQFNGKITIEI